MAENTPINHKKNLGGIKSLIKTDADYFIEYVTGEQAKLNILNSHVFKYYMSPTGEFLDYPEPDNPNDLAKINIKKVTDYNKKSFEDSNVKDVGKHYIVDTSKIQIHFDKIKGTMTVFDKRTNKEVFSELHALSYSDCKTTQLLHQFKDEYFFGGGMQNGRFTHKGEVINIVNTNNWINGGVSSPCPFYWSSNGYGVLRNTWQPGVYDFGSQSLDIVKTVHNEDYFDAFYFINPLPKDILKDYYELTGQPIFIPEYAFYEAHLNAFNRDYWVKVNSTTPGAILFEDGEYYKSYKPNEIGDKKGILESLNGEKNNYQFSARAMVDRYKRHDVPLGWFVPNDGYGSGYGQTDSLDGDIENLKEFADYARACGVEVALWTESNLHPVDPQHPKKGERDLNKEVGVAGVVALKCDVAWIGCGYSFGLNAVENAANIFVKEMKHKVRPMIIMVDGWAGTQRYAGIWSGDQTGGEWEYIRFHIPTYIGTGLSGQPIVGSDMDGIYGGKNREVNIRDYQWKTFTPLQLNMDGWGKTPKTPFSFDDESTAINRAYLKLKSMLMPYNYTIGHESIHGLPMVRAMFLEFPEDNLGYTKDCQYQFMWGPNILVAPIYKGDGLKSDTIRNDVYLPDPKQVWIDFFTGEKYQGGKVINNIKTPLWKIPVFIKDGAIIPMTNPNNNPNEILRDVRTFEIFPNGETNYNIYEDDGISSDYLEGNFATTEISIVGPKSNTSGDLFISFDTTKGSYNNMIKERETILHIMASKDVEFLKVAVNGKPLHITKAKTNKDFNEGQNIYYFTENYIVNPYMNQFAETEMKQKCLLLKLSKVDVTNSAIQIKIKDYENISKIFGNDLTINHSLSAPCGLNIVKEETTATSITLQWTPVKEAAYYEIERDGVIFSNILETKHNFEGFQYESEHSFRIRSVCDSVSKWSDFVVVTTKEDPRKYTIKGVKVSCNLPCEPCQEIYKLTDGDLNTLWHTQWDKPGNPDGKTHFLKLNFDLGDVYELDKIKYVPREDAGNGTILCIQYRYSLNGKNWSELSDPLFWEYDATVKSVSLNGANVRYIQLNVIDTVGGFGSGKQMLFYKKID